jgi:hypothetical protein
MFVNSKTFPGHPRLSGTTVNFIPIGTLKTSG